MLVLVRLSLGVAFQAAGAVAPALMRDLGLGAAAIGALAGLFWLPGVALALPVGIWAQRTGDRPLVLGGIALRAAGALLCAAATGFVSLALGRLVAGGGAVVLMVLLNKTVQDWFAGRALFLPMALYLAAWPVGIALGQSGLGWLAEAPGAWPVAFLLSAGVLLLAFAAVALARPRAPPGGAAAAVAEPPAGGGPAAARERLDAAEVRLVCLAGAAWMLINSAYLVLATFGPLLLVERGAGPAAAGLATSLMSWVFVVALPLGELASARARAPVGLCLASLVAATLFAALIPLVPWPGLAFLLHGFFYAAAAPVMSAQPAQALRPATRAPGLGLYFLWFYAGCAALPPLAGLLRDAAGPVAPIAFAVLLLAATPVLVGLFQTMLRRRLRRAAAAG